MMMIMVVVVEVVRQRSLTECVGVLVIEKIWGERYVGGGFIIEGKGMVGR